MPAALQIGARTSNSSYTMTVQSVNVDELYAWVGILVGAAGFEPAAPCAQA